MKCPKCKQVMEEMRDLEVNQNKEILLRGKLFRELALLRGKRRLIPNAFVCFNKKCLFYGIKRINEKWFFD